MAAAVLVSGQWSSRQQVGRLDVIRRRRRRSCNLLRYMRVTRNKVAMEQQCAVHKHWSRIPIEVHHVWPKGMGGPDVASNRVPVCANGHSLIHEYLRKLVKGEGQVPWLQRRLYGRKVRALAERGYAESR